MKTTASAANEFIYELPDSGDSNTSASPLESEFEDDATTKIFLCPTLGWVFSQTNRNKEKA